MSDCVCNNFFFMYFIMYLNNKLNNRKENNVILTIHLNTVLNEDGFPYR